MGQYVKVIQKNKGAFKNFLKKIEMVQDYSATCGIHPNKGRIKVQKSGRSKKGKINIATLSDILEKHITWTQRSTVNIKSSDGSNITLYKGAKMRQPARVFIQLEKVPNVWIEVQKHIQTQCMKYMLQLQKSRGKRSGQNLFLDIANWVSNRQRQRITRKETESNSELTSKIKGFNYPLFDDGTMLKSIEGRVIRNKTGKKVRCAYIADDMEKAIRKINSYVGR